jgi:acyl dehydratase
MIDRSYIGRKSEPLTVAVEPFQLRLFAKAIGETNPVYLEVEAAKAAGYRNMLAPPTFANALSLSQPDPFGQWPAMGIELAKVLHGEQKFEYFALICAGDTITLHDEITDIYDKKDGAMEFVISETTVTNQNGELVGKMTSMLVQRH